MDTTGHLLLAFLLITTDVRVDDALVEQVMPQVNIVAESLEIHGAFWWQYTSVGNQLATLRSNWRASQNLPHLWEAEEWGLTRDDIALLQAGNKAHTQHLLNQRLAAWPEQVAVINSDIETCYRLYWALDNLRDSLPGGPHSQMDRRRWLGALRKLMGPEAFYGRYQIPMIPM